MTSSKNDAAALAAKAAEATAAAELAQREAVEAKAEDDVQAEARRQKFMTKWLDEEFVQAPEADVALRASKAAFEAAFEESVKADPLMQAWLAHLRSSIRIGADGQTARTFASQVGVTAPTYYPKASSPNFFEVMNLAIQHLASRLEGERTADIFDALEAAANGEGDA